MIRRVRTSTTPANPSFADAYCGLLETLHRAAVVFATRGTPAGAVSKERGRTP